MKVIADFRLPIADFVSHCRIVNKAGGLPNLQTAIGNRK